MPIRRRKKAKESKSIFEIKRENLKNVILFNISNSEPPKMTNTGKQSYAQYGT